MKMKGWTLQEGEIMQASVITVKKKRKRVNKSICRTAQQKEWENVVIVRAIQLFNKNKKQATLRNLWSYFSAFNEDKEDSVSCLWHMSTEVFSIETLRARLQEIERIGWVSSEASTINGCKHYFAASLEFGAYGDSSCPQSKWYTQRTAQEHELGIQCGTDYIPGRPIGFVYPLLENFDDEIEKKQNISFTDKSENVNSEIKAKESVDTKKNSGWCFPPEMKLNINGEIYFHEHVLECANSGAKAILDEYKARDEIYDKLRNSITEAFRQFEKDWDRVTDEWAGEKSRD